MNEVPKMPRNHNSRYLIVKEEDMEAIVWMPSQHNPRSILLKDKEMKEVGVFWQVPPPQLLQLWHFREIEILKRWKEWPSDEQSMYSTFSRPLSSINLR